MSGKGDKQRPIFISKAKWDSEYNRIFKKNPSVYEREFGKLIPNDYEEIQVCLGCLAPTKERDCGCPAGIGYILRKKLSKAGNHKEIEADTLLTNES